MPASADQPRYYRDEGDALVQRSLDGLTLIYHRPSGITHIVDNPMPEIIGMLADEPLTAKDVLARLTQLYDIGEDSGDALTDLSGHLDILCQLGLVRVA